MTTLFGIPNIAKLNSLLGSTTGNASASTNTVFGNSTVPSSSATYIGYLLSIFVVLIVILLFIHYFVTPIFQLNPGGPGVIPIPGMSDGKVYWTKQPPIQLADTDTILGNQTINWSMTLDFYIEEPYTPSNYPRILFRRGGLLHQTPTSNTITGVAPDYNICIALAPDTNDMIVSTMNIDNNMENVIIPNVPVQTPFRVGIVLMDSIMEVYVNGMLHKTRKLAKSVKQTQGPFMPPQADVAAVGKIMNLHIWKRAISASEMRYAKPSLTSASTFSPSQMKGNSSACGVNAVSAVSNLSM